MKKRIEYVVYNDGFEWKRCDNEDEALAMVAAYDGDHEVWHEVEEIEIDD